MSWGVFEHADTVQVVPIGDLEEHDLDCCSCLPRLENDVYIHNSFDGREYSEVSNYS